MEGADPDGRIVGQPLDPPAHFVGRLVGEGQGEDLMAGDSLVQQPGDAMGDDAGLAASRAGQYQQWPLEMRDRLALGVGESVQEMFQEQSLGLVEPRRPGRPARFFSVYAIWSGGRGMGGGGRSERQAGLVCHGFIETVSSLLSATLLRSGGKRFPLPSSEPLLKIVGIVLYCLPGDGTVFIWRGGPVNYPLLGREPMGTRIPLRTTDTQAKDLADKLEMSTAEIGLSVRTTNCLEERGIFTVEDLLHCTRDDLLSISNFGEKTLEEVYKALESIGFHRQARGESTASPPQPR